MKIALYGSGGFGREIRQLIDDLSDANRSRGKDPFETVGFLDDDAARHGSVVADLPVLGGVDWVAANSAVGVVVAVGNPRVKRAIVERLKKVGAQFPTVIHPSVVCGQNVVFGEGCIVCAGTILTTDANLGSFVTINLACTVAHDDVIGDFVTMHPCGSLSGNVHLGDGVEFGTGSIAIPGVRMGAWSILGAGAVVTKDIPPHTTAVGTPAKVIRVHDPRSSESQ